MRLCDIRTGVLCVFLLLLNGLLCAVLVQDGLTKVYNVSLGETLNGNIRLYNPSDEAVTIVVSGADYVYTAGGIDRYLESGRYARSNGSFLRYSSSHTIGAKQSYQLSFSISIPNRSDLDGSYWSVLFIMPTRTTGQRGASLIGAEPQTDVDLDISFRYAVQIVTNIRNTGRVDLSFSDVRADASGVSMMLRNTGTLWVEAAVRVDIYDEQAQKVGSFSSGNNRIYPDLVRRVNIPFAGLNYGSYYAVIVADCGNNSVFGHQVSFTIR